MCCNVKDFKKLNIKFQIAFYIWDMKGRLMKKILQFLSIAPLAGLLSCAQDQYAQQGEYDDLYFSSKDRQKVLYEQELRKDLQNEQPSYQTGNNNNYQKSEYYQGGSLYSSEPAESEDRYVDYSAYTRKESTGQATTTTGGNTYITNNYNEFSDRFDRRSDWCYSCGTGFMNIGSYYDPWGWGGGSRVGVSFGFGTGWGWNSYYGYNSFYTSPYMRMGYMYSYDPFYRPYWHNPYHTRYYGYNPYMDPFGYGHWGYSSSAYYHGYYNGFYNGYYQNRYSNSYSSGNNNNNTTTRPKPVNQPRTSVGSAVNNGPGGNSGTGGRSGATNNSNRRTTTNNSYNQNARTPANYSNGTNSGNQGSGNRVNTNPQNQNRTPPPGYGSPSNSQNQNRTTPAPGYSSPSNSQNQNRATPPPGYGSPSNNSGNQRSNNSSNYSGGQQRQQPASSPTYRSAPSHSPGRSSGSSGAPSSSPSRSSSPRGGVGGSAR